MEYKTIFFSRRLSVEEAASFEYIVESTDKIKKGDIVRINLSEIDRLDSANLPLLIMLVYLLDQTVKQSIYLDAARPHILDYLFSIDFFKLNYVRARNIVQKKHYSHTGIPIKKFVGQNGRRDLLELARLQFQNDAELAVVLHVLNNLSENCLEHTSHDPELIDGFAYVEQEHGWVRIMVLDFGEGFLESFRRRRTITCGESNKDIVSDVLNKHRSSKGSMGNGIWAVENIVKERNGQLIVASGTSLARYSAAQYTDIKEIPFFSGSLIYVKYQKSLDRI